MYKKSFFLFLVLGILLFPIYSNAGDCSDPKALIQSKVEEILPILRETSFSKEQKQAKFINIFDQLIDYDWMATFILGHDGEKLTPAQKEDFSKTYRNYIISSYMGKLNDYTGNEKVLVKDVTQLNGQDSYVVNITVINSPSDEDDFSIMLRKSGSCYKLGDVVAEGVSILKTEKQDFGSVLKSQGFEVLIKTLKDKSVQ